MPCVRCQPPLLPTRRCAVAPLIFRRSHLSPALLSYALDASAPIAFAKLQGRCITDLAEDSAAGEDFVAFVTSLPAKLGRKVDESAGDISLSKSKSVSRHHATLLMQDGRIEILCVGKNGLTVNGEQIEVGKQCALTPGAAVKIGCYCFYFLEGKRGV
jgi:hypothetical protein